MNKYFIIAPLVVILAACEESNTKHTTDRPELTETESVGKNLFEGNCGLCHSLYQDKTGPKLAGVLDRWGNDTDKLVQYVRNSQVVIKAGGPASYAGKLYSKWYKTEMPSFGGLKNEDIMLILHYVDKGVE